MIYRDAKEFKSILRHINYRKRQVAIRAAEYVTLNNLNWDGGSRNSYAAFTLDGAPLGNADKHHAPAPWENAAEGARVLVPQGACLVQYGTFCGKDATAYIYVNPADMPRVLGN